MKWYNEDKTMCIDLDKIVFWNYDKPQEYLRVSTENGNCWDFKGKNADEIYKMLLPTKEVI